MPVVRVSDSFWENVAWIENFAAPADNLARAESTLVSEFWIVETRADALLWVEIEAVDLIVTILPDRLKFWAAAVMRRVPSAEAKAVIWVVDPFTKLKPLKLALLTIVDI